MNEFLKLARFHQRTGIWLLFLPCLWGIFLALKKLPDPDFFEVSKIILLFLIGSIAMRSAGCVINDLWDQKFDGEVDRTKNRPLVSGKISTFQAFIFLGILLFIGLLVLLQFNVSTILSGFAAMILVICYPLMKRITYYPQIFLGLTFNFGIIMSSYAILDFLPINTVFLYFAAIIWTVIYDSIYAFQDIEDDLKVGVKSTAIKFQQNPKIILSLLSLLMFLILIFVGYFANFRFEYFFMILIMASILSQKIKTCDFTNSENCLAVFKANILIGSLIAFAIFLG